MFPFSNSRAHRYAAEFLGDYAGIRVSDGYAAYEAFVAGRNRAVRHQGCWIADIERHAHSPASTAIIAASTASRSARGIALYARVWCRISSYLQSAAARGYYPRVAIQIALAGTPPIRSTPGNSQKAKSQTRNQTGG